MEEQTGGKNSRMGIPDLIWEDQDSGAKVYVSDYVCAGDQ